MEVVPVVTHHAITELACVAKEIWYEYWPNRMGEKQTEYMVNRFQSSAAIQKAITEEGYLYAFLKDDEETVGYLGIRPEPETKKLFVSKVYLFEFARGKGYGKQAIEFCKTFCHHNGLKSLYLSVNKDNEQAIRSYEKSGFKIVDESYAPIGDGFFIDDYTMECVLTDAK